MNCIVACYFLVVFFLGSVGSGGLGSTALGGAASARETVPWLSINVPEPCDEMVSSLFVIVVVVVVRVHGPSCSSMYDCD